MRKSDVKKKRTARARAIRSLKDLAPDPQNANRGTPRGRSVLAESLRAYGAGRSILVDVEGRVLAGNQTLAQAMDQSLPIEVVQSDGSKLVVVQRVDLDLTKDARARALALADNRTSELGLDWDTDRLKQLLDEGFDLSGLWFEAELEQLLGQGLRAGKTDPDAVPPLRKTTITPGDLFALGNHRLLCGDSTNASDVKRVLGGAAPRLTATDAPYGVNYDPSWRVGVDGSQNHALGRVRNDDRADWSEAFALSPSDVVYAWHAGLHADTVAASLRRCGFELRAQIIWKKPHFVLSRGDFHWAHEACWYAVRKGRSAQWQGDRTQSTIWEVPHLNPMGGDRSGENAPTGHATQKPIALFERSILLHTVPGEGVFEPFAGSGSCLIAAEKSGRRCYAIELDPVYVQVILDRWSAFTGRAPQPVEA